MSPYALDAVGAGALAVLELDAASVGPFLISRPLVVGPLIGWILGDAWSGAVLGAIFESLSLWELPLGGRLEFSSCVAAGVASWIACRRPATSLDVALAIGLASGLLHARIERAARRRRGDWFTRIARRLDAGRAPLLGFEIAGALTAQATTTFLFILTVILSSSVVAPTRWNMAPEILRAGFRTALAAAPWIGAGGAVAALARRA